MPIQLGMCWGHNKALNCLEYHRNSEINIGATDFVLLLAKQDKIIDGKLDTSEVVAFKAPAGAVVEVYATSLHYAPCMVTDDGFRVAVVLLKHQRLLMELMLVLLERTFLSNYLVIASYNMRNIPES